MADRWMDDRDRDWRDRDWNRSQRYGRGEGGGDYSTQGYGEDRSFGQPRGGYDRDRGYGDAGYQGGRGGEAYGGDYARQGGGQGGDQGRRPVFGERETGQSYTRGYGGQGQGGQGYNADYGAGGYGATGPYGGQSGRGWQGQYGAGGGQGGRYYGDDGRQDMYREQYGQGGTEYGSVPRGYDSPRYGGGQSYGSQQYGRGGYTPNVREGRGDHDHDRGFFEKAGDEMASWFGDRDAERRREWDKMQSHAGRGPKGYRRSDDRISDDVHDHLTDDPMLDASEIQVQVKDCEVTLSGTVESREAKRRAEVCAERVSGVDHVQNNLRVAKRDQNQPFGLSRTYGGASGQSATGTTSTGGEAESTAPNTKVGKTTDGH